MAKFVAFLALSAFLFGTALSEHEKEPTFTILPFPPISKTVSQSTTHPAPRGNKFPDPGLPDAGTATHGLETVQERSTAAFFTGVGICYSPFTADRKCKSQQAINSDVARLRKYSTIRLYGVECNQVSMVMAASKQYGIKIFAGIFSLQRLDTELQTLIRAAKGSWSSIAAVSIGNELVNKRANSPGQVVNAINKARGILRAAGYHGPVVTVDTSNTLIKHPQLCRASDFCGANAHAFYSSKTRAHEAGAFALKQAALVSSTAGGKTTIITESGWPSAGGTNGVAVPSDQNQAIAVKSLRDGFKGKNGQLFLFSAFNDKWKDDFQGSFGTEKYWGIED
ncbi:predicted protein [Uncinocarpus reesii 1704]|uniref:Cell wall glucanase n=1 Tax=Uncinocarpus reesii (strain UAMH 1704) TaxID=336963 RepID=C4JSN1_UNCRE|nr:uncharacterized protein UREG_05470 [Uncinocarpus reesii 1704]EEP80628.1 predicted protein [Uncinocarpus reesii 1704]